MSTHDYLHLLDRASRIEIYALKLAAQAAQYREMGFPCSAMRAEARELRNRAADIRGVAARRI